jgi:hypothetical protein
MVRLPGARRDLRWQIAVRRNGSANGVRLLHQHPGADCCAQIQEQLESDLDSAKEQLVPGWVLSLRGIPMIRPDHAWIFFTVLLSLALAMSIPPRQAGSHAATVSEQSLAR